MQKKLTFEIILREYFYLCLPLVEHYYVFC